MIKRFFSICLAVGMLFISINMAEAHSHQCYRNDGQTDLISLNSPLQNIGLPDLEAPECEFDEEATENTLYSVNVLVVNTGNAPSQECQIILYLSPQDDWNLRDDFAAQRASIPPLSVYEETNIEFTFVFPDMGTGNYEVWPLFYVDAYEQITEISESNLYKSEKSIQVNGSGKENLPDLKAIQCHYEKEVKENAETSITVRINNIGKAASKNCWVKLFLSPANDWNLNDDTPVLEMELTGLPVNGSTLVEFIFIFPNMGTEEYQVWPLFYVDSREQIQESSESNLFKSDESMKVIDSEDEPPEPEEPNDPVEGVYPRKVLMESFTATWCGPCASYGHLADQLADEFGPEKVLLVRNQCWKDGLNTTETDARASYYKIQGVPALVLGGTKHSHPAEVDLNRQVILKQLAVKSPFKITLLYQDKNLNIQIRNGTNQSYLNVRLITVLYESLVNYNGSNGLKEHKKVIRDYVGNEKGISLTITEHQTVEQSLPVSYSLNSSKEYYLVSFLQDEKSKEIYQAERVLVGESKEPPPKEEPEPEKPSETFKLNATCLKTGISLTWEKVAQATGGYYVYKKDADALSYPIMPMTDFPVHGTSFEVTRGLQIGESYCFIVKPVGNNLKEINNIISTEICVLYKVEEETFSVVLQIGNFTGWLDDKPFSLDVPPEITKERMFVPIRVLSEILGAKVEFEPSTKRILIEYTIQGLSQTQIIEIWIDIPAGNVNGKATYIDPNDHTVTPYISNGRTMVPMRFLGEAFLAQDIAWDPLTQKVKFVFLK